ncbi:MAG: L-threonylcarbamoyladenylate synthase [Acidobacteriota bacterium]
MRGRRLDAREDAAGAIDVAATEILGGAVVAYPTETYYALGADPRNGQALERVLKLKGRTRDKPLLLIADSVEMVERWSAATPASLRMVAEAFWPGPLTVVLRAPPGLAPAITSDQQTIALRVSSHPLARALVERCQVPLTGTSANRSGESPPTTVSQVEAALGHALAAVLDCGGTAGGAASTLLDLTTEPYRILRPGAVSVAQIAEAMRLV